MSKITLDIEVDIEDDNEDDIENDVEDVQDDNEDDVDAFALFAESPIQHGFQVHHRSLEIFNLHFFLNQ